mmetsp:Transcript_6150/g.10527  ORF Transcript_6150/g.10527 Transcript_6150/m.10527 type:complete len:623 (+) Transcript_6150:479-2347(+)
MGFAVALLVWMLVLGSYADSGVVRVAGNVLGKEMVQLLEQDVATLISPVFSDQMVIQRDRRIAVYGMLKQDETCVHVHLMGNSKSEQGDTRVENGEWKSYFKPKRGGPANYTIRATTKGCGGPGRTQQLSGILVGDVFYCSGQSNMALGMQWTFNRNQVNRELASGSWDKRIRILNFVSSRKHVFVDTSLQYVSTSLPESKQWMRPSHAGKKVFNKTESRWGQLDRLGSTCVYFAYQLASKIRNIQENVPVGIIHAAAGWTPIEAWVDTRTSRKCSETMLSVSNIPAATFYNTSVAPFINMTIAGFVWYQGEYNVDFVGNRLKNSGYACEIAHLVSKWRADWSLVPGTTNPQAPFAIVELAPWKTSKNIALFRSVQDFKMPNVFLVPTHDLGDPWIYRKECVRAGCCGKFDTDYFVPNGSDCMEDVWGSQSIFGNWYHGDARIRYNVRSSRSGNSIHPRVKRPVGERIATLMYGYVSRDAGIVQAPRFESCFFSGGKLMINILNQGDTLKYVQPVVRSGALEYCSQSRKACLSTLLSPMHWKPIDKFVVSGNKLIVGLADGVFAIRYAWSNIGCCDEKLLATGTKPCPPANCPVYSSRSKLPIIPFFVSVSGGHNCTIVRNG